MENNYPLFEVPIISPELEQEEMIIQIADALDYLSLAVSSVFDCIDNGINNQHKILDNLSHRTDIARAKIIKLTGSKSATKVFSSAKYPATDVNKRYVSIFSGIKKLESKSNAEMILNKKKVIEPAPLSEKLQFFHVRNKGKALKKNVDKNLEENLGKLPNNLDSVASLLLFNTSESLYKKYLSFDPMGVVSRIRNMEIEDKPPTMDAAPYTISQGEQIKNSVTENYLYSPSLGEVPNIDVPLDLPDLPGIADDLKFIIDHDPGFAPSVVNTPAMPDLPAIVPEVVALTESNVILPTPIEIAPPPPPPPPPPTIAPAPPPPPPPLPPPGPGPVEVQETAQKSEKTKPAPKSMAVSDDARSNLMEAIRNAGGSGKAMLKSVRENQDEKRRKEEENAIAAGGDLMADLHNRLLMRRKGISGDKSGNATAMDKVSAMIPPPPQVHHDTSSATEEEDWD